MAALSLRRRPKLVHGFAIAFAFALGPSVSLAQEPTPAAPQEKPAETLAIPLEFVSQRAESLAAELLTLLPSERSAEHVRSIEEEFDRLKGDIASRAASAESALAATPSVSRLKDIEQQLLELQLRLAEPDEKLDIEVAQLSEALVRLETISNIWEKTANEASISGTSQPTLLRIATTQEEIARVRGRVASRRNEILARRDELVDPAALLHQMLAKLRGAISGRIEGLFSLDRPPIWSPKVREAIREELSEGWTGPLVQRMDRLRQYTKERQLLLAFQLSLFVVLALGLRSTARRAKAHAEENYDLREAELVFGLPTAMALLITLGLTPQFHPLAPNLFLQLVFVSAIFPAALIVSRLFPPAMVPIVLVVPLFFPVDRLRDTIETLPTIERLVLLAEFVGALGFVLWLVRPSRFAQLPTEMLRQPFFRVIGTGMRVAIGLFLLAILAEIVGLGSLAERVGIGSLRAAYGALFFYALLKVLQSLVAYALVLRPLRLLRLVARNRALVRRRVDRGLELLMLVAWVYFVLSVFELADRGQSAVLALLSAPLGVGALSISLGSLIVFGLTVWLSFRLAHFVSFVLHEDVFSRMDYPRGVPYAVSNLTRYTLIFVGVLAAFAAAGIQLSNLSVIAGGLGVGIGFGLQNSVNNFVSGLILLFERPLSVGDVVQLQNQELWGEIRRIGIRASVIRTWEGAEVIVPNGQLISDSVTNWTLSDRRRRVEVDVGVEYGTDAQRVIDLLVEVAHGHSNLLAEPQPAALFLGFGDSALNFRLRAWISDFHEGFTVRSQLTVAIQRALTEAGISVPFPQRDLHLRTVSPDAASQMGSVREPSARGSSDEEH